MADRRQIDRAGDADGPTFTVLVPAYDAERTLGTAIRSVLAQTRDDFELVVVDDGSQDATRSIAAGFEGSDGRIRTVVHERNLGLASALQTGVTASHAPYIALLDADDLWMPGYLEAMGAALDADPDAGFAYTQAWVLDDASRRIRRKPAMARQRPPVPPPASAVGFLRELVLRNFVFGGATIRRSALEAVGGFVPSLRSVEDYELWLRLLAHGYRAVRSPGMLVIWRDRDHSLSKDGIAMRRAQAEAMRLVIDEHPAPSDVKAVAHHRQAELQREIAALERRSSFRVAACARAAVGGIRRRALFDFLYYREPPVEVTGVFGDLSQI